MNNKIDVKGKMLITEKLLNECWHEIEDKGPYTSKCNKCGLFFGAIHTSDWNPEGFNRSFNTPQDAHDILVALIDDWKWRNFSDTYFIKSADDIVKLLYNPEKFCWIISEWLKEKYENSEK